jgi:predicted signal transduction protein with EAL and GGDEF domain
MKKDDCFELLAVTQKENEQLQELLNHDYITGLPIRRVLEYRLNVLIEKNNSTKFALGVVRLDERFRRQFHDGHIAEILVFSIGQRLNSFSPGNIYQSWRLDEFIILIDDLENLNNLSTLGQTIREIVQAPLNNGTSNFRLRCKIGFAMFPEHGSTVQEILGNAELAMGIVEHSEGTNLVYNHSIGQKRRRILAIEQSLVGEIENGLEGFSLAFQPIVDKNGTLQGAEALLRWNSTQLGPIPPDEFIPVAEKYGQIQILGLWVVYTAATVAKRWTRTDQPIPIISVNVSAVQLLDPEFANRFGDLLETLGVDPSLFRIELTESVIVSDPKLAKTTLQMLKDRGVKLLIDDFGTGFSSFAYLHQLPISTIKIAKEFVDTIVDSENSRAIIRSIIQVAHSIGGTALAEGVETEAQFERLVEDGCDYFQGFLFGRPQIIENLEQLYP